MHNMATQEASVVENLRKEIKTEFINRVVPSQLLVYLTFFNQQDEEEIKAEEVNKGPTAGTHKLWLKMGRYDWYDDVLEGLKALDIKSLVEILEKKSSLCEKRKRKSNQSVYISVNPDGNHNKSWTDIKVALKIKETLEENNHECFGEGLSFDVGELSLEILSKEIEQCDYVVCIFSKAYFDDQNRLLELLLGLQRTVKNQEMVLILVKMNDVSFDDIPDIQLLRKEFKIVKDQSRFIEINNHDYDQRVLAQIEAQPYNLRNIMPAGNVAHGQAWSHFTGFLKFILPYMESKIKETDVYKKNPGKVSTKFYEMIPASAKTPKLLEGGHADCIEIEVQKLMITENIMRGGTPRSYHVTVWSVEDHDGEKYYFAGDYPAVLKAMFEFQKKLEGDFENQVRRLEYALREITNHRNNPRCHDTYRILYFDDTSKVYNLRKALINQVKRDIDKEKFLSEDFLEKNIPAEMKGKESFDSDVSFLLGDEEEPSLVKDIFEKLSKDFKCISPSQTTTFADLQELSKAKYTLMFFSKDAMQKENVTFKVLQNCLIADKLHKRGVNIIPILNGVDIDDISSYLQWLTYVDCKKNPDYIERIVQILKGPDNEIRASLPVGDVYAGLAFGYYHNYLSFILRETKECLTRERKNENILLSEKFFLVIPESCNTSNDFSLSDPNILKHKGMKVACKNAAGSLGRPYFVEIYKVKDNNKEYYFIGHFATPILALSEMVKDRIAGLSQKEMTNQAREFVKLLKNKLDSDRELENTYCIIYYDDVETWLSREILTHLQQEFPDA